MAIPNNGYLELIHYKDFSVVITHVLKEILKNVDFVDAIKKEKK